MKNPTEGSFNSLIAVILCNLDRRNLESAGTQFAIGDPKGFVKELEGLINNYAPAAKPAKAEPPAPEPTVIELDLWLDDNVDFDAGKALGEYDVADSDATAERFPSENSGRGRRMVKAKLVCFHRLLGDEENDSEVDREIGKLKIGVRGGTQAILAVGAQHKERQRSKFIVGSAFWSRPDGRRHFLYLGGDAVGRDLRLDWFARGTQWGEGAWFVVVPQE